MNGRSKAAGSLVACGCIVLLAGAALHLAAAYPRVSAAVKSSNLNAGLQSALRSVFLIVGWHWIVIGFIVLIGAFLETKLRKPIVLFCGFALLLDAGVMARFLGWFVGTDMILASALLILFGGLLLPLFPPRKTA
jgi:hypothetical protein